MIKTVSINLGGIVFQIDEDAYEALSKYLNDLTQYYKYTEGRDEIVTDIESRLGELFNENFAKSGFSVISMGDVEEVIEIMGRPEDFGDAEENEEDRRANSDSSSNSSQKKTTDNSTIYTSKRLYRDPDDAIIAGVSSGLSTYFGIADPIWIRIAFIVLTIGSFGTVAPITYIILWAILEPAETAAQKLTMKGEPINVSNLEKKIKEEFDRASDNLKGFASNHRSQGTLGKLVNFIGKLFGATARLVWVLMKVVFYIFAIGMAIVIIGSLFSVLISYLIALPIAIKYIFSSAFGWIFASIGGVLTFGIPLFLLFYLPYRLWKKDRNHSKMILPAAGILFVVGAISLAISAAEVASYFSSTEMETHEEVIPYPATDTLYLSINDEEADYRAKGLEFDLDFSNAFSFVKHLETASDWVELDILPSSNGEIRLEKVYRASGKNYKKAADNARAITHHVKVKGDKLIFDQYFGLGKKKQWRNQKVKLKLFVPDSLHVAFTSDMSTILDEADNSVNASSYSVAGNRWLMNNGVLEPLDSNLTMGSSWSKQNMDGFNFTDFSKISIKTNLYAEINQGERFEVYMSANKRQAKYVNIEKEGDELVFTRSGNRNNVSVFWNNSLTNRPHFYITVPHLDNLNIGKLAHVVLSDFSQEEMSVYLSGQGSMDMEEGEFKTLRFEMHGQSDAYLVGSTDKLYLDASGQSDFDGEEFEANNVYVNLSGQSDAVVAVKDRVEGSLSGQSDFEFIGNPKVDVQTSGQADIDAY